ncbi:MAG: hypothetical protein PHQ03_06650 [Methylococcales bacterium]|nr:hypothetical protein [Methylococcales bacterium]
MLSCKKVSLLVVQSQELPLRFSQKMSVGIHLLICRGCRAFKKQMTFLQHFIKRTDNDDFVDVNLPKQAKERIKQTLLNHF